MAGAALIATQSKLGRPLFQDEIQFVRMQVIALIIYDIIRWVKWLDGVKFVTDQPTIEEAESKS